MRTTTRSPNDVMSCVCSISEVIVGLIDLKPEAWPDAVKTHVEHSISN